jgi:chemotaxis protein CheX
MARAKSPKPRREKAVAGRKPRKAKAAAAAKKPALMKKSRTAVAAPDLMASATVALPETLDSSSAVSLKEQFLANRGSPLIVDAGQVRRTGMQAVQVLLAAAQTWRSDGQSYAVANAPDEFLETLALVGLSREHLLIEGFPG